MKHFILFVWWSCSLVASGQVTKSVSLRYNLSDFTITEYNNMCHISSSTLEYVLRPDTAAPALPYIGIYVMVESNADYHTHVISSHEIMVMSNVEMASNPQIIATNGGVLSHPNSCKKYLDADYPSATVEYKGTFVVGGCKVLAFSVCPFRYDAIHKNLYLKTDISLDIALSLDTRKTDVIPISKMGQYMKQIIVNKSDCSSADYSLNPSTPAQKSLNTDTLNYDYLIITCDSLKTEYQKLARWKNTKGVRTKILTTEDIDASHIDSTLQQKIKHIIYEYYEGSNHRLQYVLLGGCNEIVPAELCFVKNYTTDGLLTREVAADIFYSSFKNMSWDNNGNGLSGEIADSIDYSPDIIVTRLSTQTQTDAKCQIDRIINYEMRPDTTHWTNNVLLCGTRIYKRYNYPEGYMSDAHYKAEQFLYHGCIEPYWQVGQRYKLYDTGSSFAGDANYDFSASHLQEQLAHSYTFVNVDTHGSAHTWKVEYKPNTPAVYECFHASVVDNVSYTIITTTACLTNDFTETQPCLSECFMRNPDGGIIGYYGCSKEGFASADSINEGASLKYNRKMYERLFTGSHHQLGRSVYESKISFIDCCDSYGSMRWLMLGLNALCDPEMPVFLEKPQCFNNVQIYHSGDSFVVNTGGIPDCRICVMSRDDNGHSYYEVEDSVCTKTFNINNNTYNVCITKTGYIPYIAVVGTNVYLQNEDIEYDLHVFADKTFIGDNVIPNSPTGNVTVSTGKTIINSDGKTSIPRGFKVEKGASFVITAH